MDAQDFAKNGPMSPRESRKCAPTFTRSRDPALGEVWDVHLRGHAICDHPLLNKGAAFSHAEREALGLVGLLPPHVASVEDQIARVLSNYAQKSTDLERYIHLMSLLDRNETLFYRLLNERIEELLPIIYTPTVGTACQEFGRIYRRHRGMYFVPEDVERIDQVLENWPHDDVAIVVVTDGERILGLGDLGANGMGISLGKISLYVAGAGIHPMRTLPVCLDVGTDNEALRNDPLYLGMRRPRVRGPAYDALVDAFVGAVSRRFPSAIVQFEDFAKANSFRILDRWQGRARCFNDDIQGTAAVTYAGVLSGLRVSRERLEDQRVFVVGGGSAGVGIARLLDRAQVWVFDSKGLVTVERSNYAGELRPFARDERGGGVLEVAQRVRPTILIGVSGQPGMFGRELIETMGGERPMIFPLSNPTRMSECTPADARAWTGGRAIIAAGSPFPGTAQCNNMYIFPGVGLGAIVAGATRITDEMFKAAAARLASLAPEGEIYPELKDIRRISREVAVAVGLRAIEQGLAPAADEGALRARIAAEVWEPRYVPFRAA